MAEFAAGTWNLIHTENFDEYMKTIGVGFMLRQIGSKLKPTQEISMQGDNWVIKTLSTFKNSELLFTLNTPFQENTPDGRKMNTTFTLDGQKLIQEQKGDVDTTIVREFDGNKMTMTLTAKGVTCTRVYEKQTS